MKQRVADKNNIPPPPVACCSDIEDNSSAMEIVDTNNTNSAEADDPVEENNNNDLFLRNDERSFVAPRMSIPNGQSWMNFAGAMGRLARFHPPIQEELRLHELPRQPGTAEIYPTVCRPQNGDKKRRSPRRAACCGSFFFLVIILIIELVFMIYSFPLGTCIGINTFVLIGATIAWFVVIFDWICSWMVYDSSPMAKDGMYPSVVCENNEALELEAHALYSQSYSHLMRQDRMHTTGPQLQFHDIRKDKFSCKPYSGGGGFKGRVAPPRYATQLALRSGFCLVIAYSSAVLTLLFCVFWILSICCVSSAPRHPNITGVTLFNETNSTMYNHTRCCPTQHVIFGLLFVFFHLVMITARLTVGCCGIVVKFCEHARIPSHRDYENVPITVNLNALEFKRPSTQLTRTQTD